MKDYMRIKAEIDLDAIDHNLDLMRCRIRNGAPICAVVKADGYGHGAAPVAQHIEGREDLWGFACATPEEAAALRRAGIRKPLLLLGYAFPESYEEILLHEIRACVFEYRSACLLSEAAVRLGRTALIHIAVDTGMSRIGFQVSEEAADTVKRISALPGIRIEGLFTHFARCDEPSIAPADEQLILYRQFERMLADRGVRIPLHHVSNSAGLMRFPEANLDMVRAGITLYGLTPSDEVAGEMGELRPAMRLISHISFVKMLPAGRAVSYGGTFVTERDTRVATVPVGYADGYPRQLSGRGCVLVGGKRAPILGRVCMDQFMVDVTDAGEVQQGDEVVLMGAMRDDAISAEEIGGMSGRFNYELVCDITKRVPRTYVRHGRPFMQVDYFG